jgi:ABC-type transport system substrate-binding protein
MPQVSADARVWTVRLQPGIFFADDPAFQGRPRELVAADYVYAYKRFFDPATRARPTRS